jgi:hypothetical protein
MPEKIENLPALDESLVYALGELFEYIADVAIALRMNSAYNSSAPSEHQLDDVMWLSDSLHNLDGLGMALKEGRMVEQTINGLISNFNFYLHGDNPHFNYKSSPADTYGRELYSDISPSRAIKILNNIKRAYKNEQ